jgi:hypothetical protein
MRADRFELPLRIVVAEPIPGVGLALLRGASRKATLVRPIFRSVEALVFDLDITVAGSQAGGQPRFLGPYVQGPPAERFVYVCVWQEEGDPVGRMKVPLRDLGWPLIEALPTGGRVEGRVPGRNAKGGPALATVAILPPGWSYGDS